MKNNWLVRTGRSSVQVRQYSWTWAKDYVSKHTTIPSFTVLLFLPVVRECFAPRKGGRLRQVWLHMDTIFVASPPATDPSSSQQKQNMSTLSRLTDWLGQVYWPFNLLQPEISYCKTLNFIIQVYCSCSTAYSLQLFMLLVCIRWRMNKTDKLGPVSLTWDFS